MKHSLLVKSGLLFIVLATEFVISSAVRANISETILQNQPQLEQESQNLAKQSSSQKLWQNFRQQQDERMLRQQQRFEQFRLQNQLNPQQPHGQLRLQNQLRQQPFEQFQLNQQRQQMETLKLQQQLRQQQ
ncbi:MULTISPECIES: hypothetical protein [unclassified Tolypothrix]|uniref:hypothetical protein n=1 Tax=unclassified Tolypothrix TaxID=2649714 RepID=UPI0005EAC210|nr:MULTISPECIES: hypothetical protein [unclassified Tolypothrix]BAY90825.1 hypothetical protein NIES3275_28420 [Microchaete diplosiphon NIES-3275]EKF04320.1 hypothetical protein FDUTEX481_01998 [Tolypothrix sp. PCC 7601]MBE9085460.1 hypothetical protein [Tolypothrix sp. LEGE 11397]UYD24953.1 hypothetical protein HGR01_26610 [Tolypothrix sp. PCC 7712]UYD32812.1 hypothetical protein HG267_28025 [Tolypothrix sp. PCC 7601]